MDPTEQHAHEPDASFDGGDLDCGGGLLLLIRRHIDPLERGGLLEILSTDSTVEVELPAWCRLTSNELVSWTKHGGQRSFLVCKGSLEDRAQATAAASEAPATPAASVATFGEQHRVAVTIPESLPRAGRRAGDRAAVRDGRRQLAAAALDAQGDARPPRGQARRGGVPGHGG